MSTRKLDYAFDNRCVLDYISERRQFSLEEMVGHYRKKVPDAPVKIGARIQEYLRQLCAVKVLRKERVKDEYRLLVDLNSPV